MAIARVSGNILQDNLQRGANLSIQGNLAYFDVTNNRVGINTDITSQDLTIAGNLGIGNYLVIDTETISSTANIVFSTPSGNISVSNVYVQDVLDPLQAQDAATKNYVDTALSSLLTFEDDGANTTGIAAGDTVFFNGTANQISVVVSSLAVNFSLTPDVTIGNTLTVIGNVDAANITSSGNITAVGNIEGGNLISEGAVIGNVEISGNLTVNNLNVLEIFQGNIVNISNTISATGNIIGGNLIANADVTTVTVTASGNVTGANIATTGNVDANNVNVTANVMVTGTVDAGNLVTDSITGNTALVISTQSNGNITLDPNGSGQVILSDLLANSVIYTDSNSALSTVANFTFDGSNLELQGQAVIDNFTIDATAITSNANITIQSSANGNIDITPDGSGVVNINNIAIADNTISSTIGNIVLDPVDDIIVPDQLANAVLYSGPVNDIATTANLTFDGANLVLLGSANIDNIRIDGTDISSNANLTITATTGNLVFDLLANGITQFLSTSSLTLPIGNTAQRPGTPDQGTIRFNTNLLAVEVWDGSVWEPVGQDFVQITNQIINGDGSTDTFTLDESTTEAAIIVATNGVVQTPGVAYTVSGNQITFAEPPQISDAIDIRFTSAVTTVNAITNLSGNAEISVTTQGVANIATCDSLQLPTYTVAQTANIASPAAGQVIYVSNGDSGNPCIAVYSGGAWKRVALGANISA